MTHVPVLPTPTLRAYPKYEVGGQALYVELGEALARAYCSDAHFAAYSVPSIKRRLDSGAPAVVPVPMVLAVVDVDAETSHRATGGDGSPAPEAWWQEQRSLVDALRFVHPGLFVYRTRGGYRIVGLLATPMVIASKEDASAWTKRYIEWCAYLSVRFGIVADSGCGDWTRLFRLPRATREGNASPENRDTIGDPHAIGVWAPHIGEAEREFAAMLVPPKGERAPRAVRSDAPAYRGDGLLFFALRARGWVGDELEPGKWSIRCPNGDSHSKGEDFDSSTVLYAPAHGAELGAIHCKHQHCVHLGVRDWLRCFSDGELETARAAAGIRRAS